MARILNKIVRESFHFFYSRSNRLYQECFTEEIFRI